MRSIGLALAFEALALTAVATLPRRSFVSEPLSVSVRSEGSTATEPSPVEPEVEERETRTEVATPQASEVAAPELPPAAEASFDDPDSPFEDSALEPEPPAPLWRQRALERVVRQAEATASTDTATETPVAEDASADAKAAPPPQPERPSTPELLAGWNDPPRYPGRARRLGQEGSAVFAFRIDASGLVETLTLVRSTGHRLLDLAADRALRRWRFDRGPASFEWTIDFRLDGTVRGGEAPPIKEGS